MNLFLRRHSSAAAVPVALAGMALSERAAGQSTEPFPAVFELSSLLPINGGDGSNGFVLNGIDAHDSSGASVSSAGDVNGDGIDDLLIGAVNAAPNGIDRTGESYIVFGGAGVGGTGAFELSSLNGSNGLVLNGIDAGDESGGHACTAGDVNGDGLADVLIGAIRADPNGIDRAGESYVVFGAIDMGSPGAGIGASLELSSLDGTNGFVLNGINVADMSGRSVSSAGDFNGDGIEDLMIGAIWGDPNGKTNAGESYVVFGGSGLGSAGVIELAGLDGSNGCVLNGVDRYDQCSNSVSSAGDVNGDGFDDLIIGARLADTNGIDRTGESYVVFGGAGVGSSGVIQLSTLNGSNGFSLNGIGKYDHSGNTVCSAGDVNGDGFDDLLIGAPYVDQGLVVNAGQSYVVFGDTDVGSTGNIELSSLDGHNGFVLNGIDVGDRSGMVVSSAGDINGDGIDDLLVGAGRADPNGRYNAGECYVVFGVRGIGTTGEIELSSLNGFNGLVINGFDNRGFVGHHISSAGDVNGDGVDDLILGVANIDRDGKTNVGQSFVVFGRKPPLPCVADLNGDGFVDGGDISAFVSLFLAFDEAVDLNGDGFIDTGDIQTFVSLFLAGC